MYLSLIPVVIRTVAVILLLGSAAIPGRAGQAVTQWYFGSWTCSIDGRAARMVWKVVDDPQTECHGGVCTTTSGVAVVGRFSDSGSAWVPLKAISNRGNDFRFRYTGDNTTWRLVRDPQTGKAKGNTIWQGRSFPLSCWGRRP